MPTAAAPALDLNALIVEHMHIVKICAYQLRRTMPKAKWWLVEELIGEGMLGLVECAPRYDPRRGSFRTFASLRIKGQMLDYLRRSDMLTRNERKKGETHDRQLVSLRAAAHLPTPDTIAPLEASLSVRYLFHKADLSERTATVLYLQYWRDLDNPTIGKAIKVSPGRVYQIATGGRELLRAARKRLQAECCILTSEAK